MCNVYENVVEAIQFQALQTGGNFHNFLFACTKLRLFLLLLLLLLLRFLRCDAVSAVLAVGRCLSVRPSVIYCIETANDVIKILLGLVAPSI